MKRALVALALLTGCDGGSPDSPDLSFPYEGGAPKADAFGRSLAGVASPYGPDPALANPEVAAALDRNVRRRREQAWRTVQHVLDPVPLLGLADAANQHEEIELPDGEVPLVPRFTTWYGADEIGRMFAELYGDLEPSQRRDREPFAEEAMAEIFEWNARAAERSDRWPLERYIEHVSALGECPPDLSDEDCAEHRQSQFSGATGGVARIAYSPRTATHILNNYSAVLQCIGELDSVDFDAQPEQPSNFTSCFDAEFPTGAVLVKAQWSRVGFGRTLAAFDTDAEAIARRLGAGSDWGEDGDRRVDPEPDRIHTIRLRNGATYRLTAMHIMTKELRHWQWVTLWWSDYPQADFGADRPDSVGSPWSNYKMCAVTAYEEADADGPARFGEAPTLAAALAVTAQQGAPSWCSNPYIEHGPGNAATNCVGCHQHGGATVGTDWDGDGTPDPLVLEDIIKDGSRFEAFGRTRLRDVFPTDYLWSFSRLDDFSTMLRREVETRDAEDARIVDERIAAILSRAATPELGAGTFATRCAECHGETGDGGIGPSLFERVPARDDNALLRSLLLGRGQMPAWGDVFTDQEFRDLQAFLRATFG